MDYFYAYENLIYASLISGLLLSRFFKSKIVQLAIYLLMLRFLVLFYLSFSDLYYGYWAYLYAIGLLAFTSYKAYPFYKNSLSNFHKNDFLFILQYAFLIFVLVLNANILLIGAYGYEIKQNRSEISLDYPFIKEKGVFVLSGGNFSHLNEYLYIDSRRYLTFFSKGPKSSFDVLSPCDGKVVNIITAKELDEQSIEKHPGNTLVIDCERFSNTKIILSNLDLTSLQVAKGDNIKFSEKLARSGNSEYRARSGLIVYFIRSDNFDLETILTTGKSGRILFDRKTPSKNQILPY